MPHDTRPADESGKLPVTCHASRLAETGAVIVTSGETRTALAATRSLGTRGSLPIILAERAGCLAGSSRFASKELLVPSETKAPEEWAAEVSRICALHAGATLLPLTEAAIGNVFCARLHEDLDVIAPRPESYAIATDKYQLIEHGRNIGLSVPDTRLIESPASLTDLPEGFRFPVVLKSRRSRWLNSGRWQSGAVRMVKSQDELRMVRDHPGLQAGALLQEFIPGHGEGLFFLSDRGTSRAWFAHRRLREKPPTGGVSVLSESIEVDPLLRAAGEKLLGELRWHGVAMLEFRRAPDGRAYLMELNPRLWGSVQLAIDSGVDFPALLVAMHRGLPLPPIEPRVGVRLRWLLGDLDHLAIALRRPAVRRSLGVSISTLFHRFLKSFGDGTRLEVLRRDDPRPFLAELRARLR